MESSAEAFAVDGVFLRFLREGPPAPVVFFFWKSKAGQFRLDKADTGEFLSAISDVRNEESRKSQFKGSFGFGGGDDFDANRRAFRAFFIKGDPCLLDLRVDKTRDKEQCREEDMFYFHEFKC